MSESQKEIYDFFVKIAERKASGEICLEVSKCMNLYIKASVRQDKEGNEIFLVESVLAIETIDIDLKDDCAFYDDSKGVDFDTLKYLSKRASRSYEGLLQGIKKSSKA